MSLIKTGSESDFVYYTYDAAPALRIEYMFTDDCYGVYYGPEHDDKLLFIGNLEKTMEWLETTGIHINEEQ